MNASTTSISFSLLCLLLGLESASAWGFSFGNLMFAVNMCHVPGPGCHVNCGGPLPPKQYCSNQCSTSSSSDRKLSSSSSGVSWSEAACENMSTSSPYYDQCVAGATADCEEVETDSDAAYVDGSSSYVDETNTQTGTPNSSRMSFLPYIIAATVATMFVGLFVWKKKRDRQALENETLLGDDESFHGSVAKRLSNIGSGKGVSSLSKSAADTSFVKSTGYALA